jgi:two-component system sensor histidine kinase MprB
MSFRSRLILISAAAVAAAVLVASGGMYFVVRSQLRAEVDTSLKSRVHAVKVNVVDGGVEITFTRAALGGAGGYVQVVAADGQASVPSGESGPLLPVTAQTKDVAAGRAAAFLADEHVGGVHVRVLTTEIDQGLAVQLARPLDEVDQALSRLRLILLGVAVAGIALAAGLGTLVARTTLAPVRRLTDATEHVTATSDLTRRIEVIGSDELSRLALSFNSMLGALEASLAAQRQLVADASHELRTPLTSLRTNIEVLQRGSDLPREERQHLLRDVVGQLEELTVLVGDLVELARGNRPEEALEDVRLDQVVAGAVERQRKLTPGASFATDLDRAMVRAAPGRLDRAVRNLLDNAVKWSPPGAPIEVRVRGGEVSVRDHGPGVAAEDLPFVFDRFFRSRRARGLPGSGLGLAIVKQVAESHRGAVRAEDAEGGGARFRLWIPPLAPPPPTGSDGLSILQPTR